MTGALDGAEHRPGQREMAERVAQAVETGRHAIVQAGTGTGKTLAYLVPLVLSGQRVVVATATKALQDQLANKDLPFLDEHLPAPFEWAVLKGRSNYLCLQRLREVNESADGQLELDGMATTTKAEIKRLAGWAGSSPTGDQAELDWTPSDSAWRSVSVGSDECPGADRCPLGQQCFAELARRRAGAADVIVVNTHLYGLHVASGGVILPEHDVVVFDEAHGLEDIMSDTVGVTIAPSRFVALAAVVRRILDDPALIASVTELAELLGDAIGPLVGQRLPTPLPDAVREFLGEAQDAPRPDQRGAERDRHPDRGRQAAQAPRPDDDRPADRAARHRHRRPRRVRRLRVRLTRVAAARDRAARRRPDDAGRGVGRPRRDPHERDHPGIARRRASACRPTEPTSPMSAARSTTRRTRSCTARGTSPTRGPRSSVPRCTRSWLHSSPPPEGARSPCSRVGGRWTRPPPRSGATVPYTILTQRDLPKPALVRAFAADDETCLFATAGLFQGVDVPGSTLSLVVIDRIPFPRPDDPLLSARRELLGPAAFGQIDLPRAAMLLAQACGRLIRTATDRGVVAVLDPRLATARYRWDIVRALPPMRRTRHRADAEEFLRQLVPESVAD